VEWSQDFEKYFYKLGFDRERSGIQTKASPQFKNQYSVEVGYRIILIQTSRCDMLMKTFNNLGNVQGERQRNQFLGVEYAINF